MTRDRDPIHLDVCTLPSLVLQVFQQLLPVMSARLLHAPKSDASNRMRNFCTIRKDIQRVVGDAGHF